MLAKKAVANYNKSAEDNDELLHMDGVDSGNGLFEKFNIISMNSVLYLFSIEIAFSAIMSLAMVSLVIYRAIFNWCNDWDISREMSSKLSPVENICKIEIFDD